MSYTEEAIERVKEDIERYKAYQKESDSYIWEVMINRSKEWLKQLERMRKPPESVSYVRHVDTLIGEDEENELKEDLRYGAFKKYKELYPDEDINESDFEIYYNLHVGITITKL